MQYCDCEFTVSLEIFATDTEEVQLRGITMHHALDDYSDDDRFVAQLEQHRGAILRIDGVKLMHNESIDDSHLMLFDIA